MSAPVKDMATFVCAGIPRSGSTWLFNAMRLILQEGQNAHDPECLTHASHRNDGRDGRWKDQLAPSVIRSMLREHHDWIERPGYSCD